MKIGNTSYLSFVEHSPQHVNSDKYSSSANRRDPTKVSGRKFEQSESNPHVIDKLVAYGITQLGQLEKLQRAATLGAIGGYMTTKSVPEALAGAGISALHTLVRHGEEWTNENRLAMSEARISHLPMILGLAVAISQNEGKHYIEHEVANLTQDVLMHQNYLLRKKV